MIQPQVKPITVGTAGNNRRTFCLLLGDQVAQFRSRPDEWICEGTNRSRHVHVNADTLARLIEQNRATILDQDRGIVAYAAADSSRQEGEAA